MSIFDKLLIPYVSKLSNVNSCVGNVSNVTPFQYLNWLSIWNKYFYKKKDGINGGNKINSISNTGGYQHLFQEWMWYVPYILPFGYNIPPFHLLEPDRFPNRFISCVSGSNSIFATNYGIPYILPLAIMHHHTTQQNRRFPNRFIFAYLDQIPIFATKHGIPYLIIWL